MQNTGLYHNKPAIKGINSSSLGLGFISKLEYKKLEIFSNTKFFCYSHNCVHSFI